MKKETTWNLEDHYLGDVVRCRKLNLRGIPKEAERVDLRFLSRIGLGDTWSGGTGPADGLQVTCVMYGNRIVYERHKIYHNSSAEGRTELGNKMYEKLYFASRAFFEIQKIARDKHPNNPEARKRKEKKGWDCVNINPEQMLILKNHPQFNAVVDLMGIELKPVRGSYSNYRVHVV